MDGHTDVHTNRWTDRHTQTHTHKVSSPPKLLYRAGLLPGDQLHTINDQNVDSLSLDDVHSLLTSCTTDLVLWTRSGQNSVVEREVEREVERDTDTDTQTHRHTDTDTQAH